MEVKSSPEAEYTPAWQDAQAPPAMLAQYNGRGEKVGHAVLVDSGQTPPEWKRYETPPASEEPGWHA